MRAIRLKLIHALSRALRSLSFPEKEFSLAPPKISEFGDLSSNIALLLARDLNKPPMDICKSIADELNNSLPDHVHNISITKPGFLNFQISKDFFQSQITEILKDRKDFGKGDAGYGKTANVEFVSANPTGPLTVGHGRNAILGDTVSNLLQWQGFEVTREYYFNDAGRQMRILGESVEARYYEILGKSFDFPKDGYQGKYILDIAKHILKHQGKNLKKGDGIFQKSAEEIIFKEIKRSLIVHICKFGVLYQVLGNVLVTGIFPKNNNFTRTFQNPKFGIDIITDLPILSNSFNTLSGS